MHGGRMHRKVWLWWNRWFALQFVNMWDEASLGIRFNWRRPLLDLYCGPLTIAFGRHVVYTDERTRHWDSCRGMLFPDDPHHPIDATEARVL